MDLLGRTPFTLVFLGLMVVSNWLAGTLSGRLPFRQLTEWGISHQRLLRGEALRLLTGTFLSHDRAMFLRQMIFAGGVIGYYEWRFGTEQAFVMFTAINVLGLVVVVFGVLPVLAVLMPQRMTRPLHSLDVGMSAGGFGLIGAILVGLPYAPALLAAATLAIGVKMRLKFEVIADMAHLICLLLGFAAQAFLMPS
jgi:hypothetical protein